MSANFIHAMRAERNARITIWNLNFHRRGSKFTCFLPENGGLWFHVWNESFPYYCSRMQKSQIKRVGPSMNLFYFSSPCLTAWIESSLLRENTPCVRQNTLSSFGRVHRENTIPLVSMPFIYRSPHFLIGEITMGRLIARGTIKRELLGDCRFNYARIVFRDIVFLRCQNWRGKRIIVTRNYEKKFLVFEI